MSSIDTRHAAIDTDDMKFKEQLKYTARDMYRRSKSSAVNFAMIGAIFSGSECIMQGVCI